MATRIQLCGRLAAQIEGRRIESELPGRQGRLLFAYLAANRRRPTSRDELMEALWPGELPRAAESSLSAVVSKVRRAAGADRLEGRSELRLALPPGAWIDLEAAGEALHRAEGAHARADWAETWVAARVAQHIAVRPFLPADGGAWIDERRRQLEDTYVRSLELAARASLEIGGSELDTAERSARTLVRQAPFRESGHRLLMETLTRRGNPAEALHVYERLRTLLRDELGTAPAAETQAVHRHLLA